MEGGGWHHFSLKWVDKCVYIVYFIFFKVIMKLLKSLLANVVICGLLLFLSAYFGLGMMIEFQDVLISDLTVTGENILALIISFAIL